jgi:hypothetical protein
MTYRRLSLAALLVALVLPASALAQSRGSASRPAAGTSLGVLVGFEDGRGGAGLALRADGILDQRWIAPKVLLSGVLSLGFTHFGEDYDYYDGFYRTGWERSENLFKIIPAARFTFAVAPQLGLYADAGLGLFVASWSQSWSGSAATPGWYPAVDDTDVGVAMRLGGGAFFDVSRTFRLGAELAVNPYFGAGYGTSVSLMGAATFRL